MEHFGDQLALQIEEELRSKILYPDIEDKCMFIWAQNGEFSVKRAHQMITQLQPLIRPVPDENANAMWKKIRKAENVYPKIKFFFWRILNRALPTSFEIARRIQTVQPECRICNSIQEDTVHAIFRCPYSKATWFQSILGFRTETLSQGSVLEIMTLLWKDLQAPQIILFMFLAWQIWKARCSNIFNNVKCNPISTLRQMDLNHHPLNFSVLAPSNLETPK